MIVDDKDVRRIGHGRQSTPRIAAGGKQIVTRCYTAAVCKTLSHPSSPLKSFRDIYGLPVVVNQAKEKAVKTTTRILTTGAAVAILGAMAAYAFAQQGEGFGPGMMGMRHGMMMGGGHEPMMNGGYGPMTDGFADPAERLEAVKQEIGIKPEQQAAWDAYSKTVQETAAAMQKQRREGPEKVNTAAETLLGALDDVQKAKAGEILPGVAGPGPGMRHSMMGGHGMGHCDSAR